MTDADPHARASARRVPVRRRSAVARAEARLRPRAAAAARWRKCGCSWTASSSSSRRSAMPSGSDRPRSPRRSTRSRGTSDARDALPRRSRATPTSRRCARACWRWRANLGWLSADERARRAGAHDRRAARAQRRRRRRTSTSSARSTATASSTAHRATRRRPPARRRRARMRRCCACLGSAEARARVVQALTSGDEADVAASRRSYLRHRPIDDAGELRAVDRADRAHARAARRRCARWRRSASHRLVRSREPRRAGAALSARRIGGRADGHRRRPDPRRLPDASPPEIVQTLREHRRESPHGRGRRSTC